MSRNQSQKNFGYETSIGIGLKKNWYRKKSRNRSRKILVPKKSLGIGIVQILGLVTHCNTGGGPNPVIKKFRQLLICSVGCPKTAGKTTENRWKPPKRRPKPAKTCIKRLHEGSKAVYNRYVRLSSIECRVLNVQYRMLSIKCRVSNVEHRMSSTKSSIECQVLIVECRMLSIKNSSI